MQTLKRNERLKKKQIIQDLFTTGNTFHQYPITVLWKRTKDYEVSPVQVLFSVSKKRFRKAVDRNKIKRLLRESYRKNNNDFYQFLNNSENNCTLAIIYTAKEILPYFEIEKKIISVLKRLIIEYEKNIG
jgi:ribonuclease P protein component